MTDSAERDRIRTIINSDIGKALPRLANMLAFDSAVSADAAGKILAAAQADIDRAVAEATTQAELSAGASSRSFADHKAGSGALGLAGGVTAPDSSDGGWKSAVEAANARFQ